MAGAQSEPVTPNCSNNHVLVLLGRTGSGKSSTGNSILNTANYLAGQNEFDSARSMISSTVKTEWGRVKYKNKELVVIDTPGLFDTRREITHEKVMKEVTRCTGIAMIQGYGIGAFILTLNVDDRFTDEHVASIKIFQRVFGKEMMKYVILLFTRKDQLERDEMTLEQFLEGGVPDFLDDVLTECDRRTIAFDNKEKDNKKKTKQPSELIKLIDKTKEANDHRPFHNAVTDEVMKITKKDEHNYENHDQQADAFADEESWSWGAVFKVIFNVATLGVVPWASRKLKK
ncbi:uncharacterized protein LOC144433713 [Glandiceps talaboti]